MSIDLEFEYFTFHSLDFDAGIDVSNLPKKKQCIRCQKKGVLC